MIINNLISRWLYLCTILVMAMVILGGYTRLSGSGLSMVEWKPLTGIFPPLNTQAWLEEFTKYQASPEYRLINQSMSLEEFKSIYFVEYWHRLLGKVTALCFFLPMFYFLYRRLLSLRLIKHLSIICLLGIAQGFFGWYMVKSGLKHDPHVSHYRLALHLATAMLIYIYLLWLALDVQGNNVNKNKPILILTILIFCQIVIGALVSGLKAGLVYNDFPLMNGQIIPNEILHNQHPFFSTPICVQFLHRLIAWIILIYSLTLYFLSPKRTQGIIKWLLVLIIIQFSLGIITLLKLSPWQLALLHQFIAMILLGAMIVCQKKLEGIDFND